MKTTKKDTKFVAFIETGRSKWIVFRDSTNLEPQNAIVRCEASRIETDKSILTRAIWDSRADAYEAAANQVGKWGVGIEYEGRFADLLGPADYPDEPGSITITVVPCTVTTEFSVVAYYEPRLSV